MPDSSTSNPKEVYAVFCGAINEVTAQRVASGIALASANKVEHIHLLFQSAGGYVGDGVFLYNLLRSSGIKITVYNGGQVSSAGVTAYLGGSSRKVSPQGTFMVHRTIWQGSQPTTAKNLAHMEKSAIIDDERTEAILRKHVAFPDETWMTIQFHDVYLTAAEAVQYGIADEIADFSPPSGVQIYNLLAAAV
jgi:ATP-dependent Clp protease protease subunit